MTDHVVRSTCRICGSRDLDQFLDLGSTPLANALVRPDRSDQPEARFPLATARCLACGQVQLTVVVAPQILFKDYRYASSASSPLLPHFDGYARELVERFAPSGSFVVEIGSNDGVLLRPLSERGTLAIGVEPATDLAAMANARGLRTVNEFFSADVGRRLRAEHGPARAVVANNVLAHIDDLGDVIRGLDALLDDEGVFVAEVPYLGDLIDRVEYDTIYHEHLSYFALGPLSHLFDSAGMQLFDVHRVPIHGGSLRIFAGRARKHRATAELEGVRGSEDRSGLGDASTYRRFAGRVAESRAALRAVVASAKADGKRLAALGATAKGNTLLNYCEIGADTVAYIGDSTTLKQGLLSPGMHVPIVPEARLNEDRPDLILLLAWNYADAIVPRYRDYLEAGGRFIHPIPLARIIGP